MFIKVIKMSTEDVERAQFAHYFNATYNEVNNERDGSLL